MHCRRIVAPFFYVAIGSCIATLFVISFFGIDRWTYALQRPNSLPTVPANPHGFATTQSPKSVQHLDFLQAAPYPPVSQQSQTTQISQPVSAQAAASSAPLPPPLPVENATLRARWNELTPEERGNIMVYDQCNRSVVNINTQITRTNFFLGDFDVPGGGSGIVLDKEGHILTNYHVVENASKVEVTLFNGTACDARKIGVDPFTDIAVLKIDAPEAELHPVSFGDSTQLLVGQKVYAIGNPFGLESTLTSGIISSLNRSISGRSKIRPIRGTIQIDAAINPGNSGGPLLDTRGRMIGMNTAIASRVEQSSGVGFAIPSNTIQRIVPQILRNGKVVRGDVGIARVLETDEGLVVLALVGEGAAEQSGIRGPTVRRIRERRNGSIYEGIGIDRSTADIILSVNGVAVSKAEDFVAHVEENKPGDRITLTVLREGKRVDVPVTLN